MKPLSASATWLWTIAIMGLGVLEGAVNFVRAEVWAHGRLTLLPDGPCNHVDCTVLLWKDHASQPSVNSFSMALGSLKLSVRRNPKR